MAQNFNSGNDSFTTTEYVSWGSRLKESIGGVIFGLILFAVSFPLLFWNEGRAVKTARALEEGAGQVISVPAGTVNPTNESKLIHISGMVTTDETLRDPVFGVKADGLKLKRQVEMYQWKESKETKSEKKLGGGEQRTTTFTYEKVWSEYLIDSDRFKKIDGHSNPAAMPYSSETITVKKAELGAFDFPQSLIAKMSGYVSLEVDEHSLISADPDLVEKLKAVNGYYYLGDPAKENVGDLKISFSVVEPQTVSVVSKQVSSSLKPFVASNGRSIELLEAGVSSAADMFQSALKENTLITWAVRFGGFLIMLIGLALIFRPLSVVADVIPFLGDLLSMGIGIFSFVLAAPLSLLTIAAAWIFYRPVVGGILMAIAVGIFFLAKQKAARNKEFVPPIPGS